MVFSAAAVVKDINLQNIKNCLQRSKLTFSKSRLLATFNCKMVAINKNSVSKKKLEGEDTL